MLIPSVSRESIGWGPVDRTGLPWNYLNEGELEAIVALVRQVEPLRVLEVGVNEGRTAAALLRNVPSIQQYIGVDVPPEYVTSKECQRREVPDRPGHLASADPRFQLVLRRRGSLDLSPMDFASAFDVVFIDGDHGRDAVINDTRLAFALGARRVIWHDYHNLGTVDVRDVLDYWFSRGMELRHVERTWLVYLDICGRPPVI